MCNQFKDTLIDMQNGIVDLGLRFSVVAKYFIGKIIVWAMYISTHNVSAIEKITEEG